MNTGQTVLMLLLISAAFVGSCTTHHLSDHQQRALEATCQCRCTRVPSDDPALFQRWAHGDPTLTMAWGGGMWQCAAEPEPR